MKKEIYNLLLVVLSAFLSATAVKGFVEPANLYPAGFLGIAVFITNISKEYFSIQLSYNFLYLLLNILSTFLVLKVAGKKLIIYSILQYLFVSFFISILPSFLLVEDNMLLSIFGGVIAGISCWLALHANASSGGTDFIAIYFSTKFKKSCWTEVMIFNIIILLLAGVCFGFSDSFYSIIYQFVVTAIINKLHTRYQLVALHIITNKSNEIEKLIFSMTEHGLTKIAATGAYSGSNKTLLYMICNQFEAVKISREIMKIDPGAFISETKTNHVTGYYLQQRLS